MAKPKLALIPATQGSKLYSVLPADGVGDFDFSRGSAATRINKDGLIETVASGVSRLNYPLIDGKVVGCPSHILEPQRTNLVTYSEDFSQSYWTEENTLITSNSVISPDGTLSADKIIATATNSAHSVFVSLSSSISAGTSYCYSFFAKAEEYTKTAIRIGGGGYSTQPMAVINLLNGSVVSQQGFINLSVKDFSNGWYKINAVFTATSSVAPNIQPIADGFTTILDNYTYNGDGTSGIYIWGAMFEQGSFPTSYIPNYGTSAGITRSAETANGAGDASTFNDSEGVLMLEISALADSVERKAITISDGISNSERVLLSYEGQYVRAFVYTNSLLQCNFQVLISDVSLINKIALKYKTNDFSLFVNGFQIATDSIGVTANNLDRLSFSDGTGSNPFYGNTKQIQYFDSALNDSDLEKLTSWVSFTDMANGQLYTIE